MSRFCPRLRLAAPQQRTLLPLPLVLLLIAGCQPENEYQPPPPPGVTVAAPLVQRVTTYIEEPGTTEAVEIVKIRARVRGFVDEVKFKTEDDVQVGDELYLIEKQLYEAEVNKAKAALAVAQADYLNADARYKRAVPLAENKVISQEELEERKAQRAVAQAQIYAAQANLNASQIDLDYCVITTPISGRVGKTLVKKGNLVDGNEATHLTTVVNMDSVYANFFLSERALLEIIEQAPRRRDNGEEVDKSEIKMYLSREIDGDKFPFEGHLDYWDVAVEEGTGTYLIRGVFPNADKKLLPGMSVRIRVPKMWESIAQAVLLPEYAVSSDQIGKYVWIVGDGNTVERRDVTLGEKIDQMVIVLDGLTGAERVITEGIQRARPGLVVSPSEKPLPPVKTYGVPSTDDASDELPPPAEVDASASALGGDR